MRNDIHTLITLSIVFNWVHRICERTEASWRLGQLRSRKTWNLSPDREPSRKGWVIISIELLQDCRASTLNVVGSPVLNEYCLSYTEIFGQLFNLAWFTFYLPGIQRWLSSIDQCSESGYDPPPSVTTPRNTVHQFHAFPHLVYDDVNNNW